MYRKILVPLDGSALAEHALGHAEEIARGTGAEILLVQSINITVPVAPEAVFIAGDEAIEEVTKASGKYLETIAAPLRTAGFTVRTMVDDRPPTDAILHAADREGVDLIVMSSHGRSGFSRLVMGSVAESVLHATRRTMVLVRPELPATEPAHRNDQRYLQVP